MKKGEKRSSEPSSSPSKGPKIKKHKPPKDRNAPRLPLNGYIRFLNKHRERVKNTTPGCNFAEVTKVLAAEWAQLPSEEKKQFLEEAEKDKERYLKELESYQLTDAYKNYIQKRKEGKKAEKKAAKMVSKQEKKDAKSKSTVQSKEDTVDATIASVVSSVPDSSSPESRTKNENAAKEKEQIDLIPSFDIPIFTEEFLDHNKAREGELRQLRKLNTEYEEQNAILSKHIDNMKSGIEKLESEVNQQQHMNDSLFRTLTQLRKDLTMAFDGVAVPNTNEYPNIESIENYLESLAMKLVKEKGSNKENTALLNRVYNIISKLDLSFENAFPLK